MAYTTEQIQALRDAIATGALEVQSSSGERIRYRSLTEMRSVLQTMEAEVAAADPDAPKRVAFINPRFEKGC